MIEVDLNNRTNPTDPMSREQALCEAVLHTCSQKFKKALIDLNEAGVIVTEEFDLDRDPDEQVFRFEKMGFITGRSYCFRFSINKSVLKYYADNLPEVPVNERSVYREDDGRTIFTPSCDITKDIDCPIL